MSLVKYRIRDVANDLGRAPKEITPGEHIRRIKLQES